jgi:hypothetical protein
MGVSKSQWTRSANRRKIAHAGRHSNIRFRLSHPNSMRFSLGFTVK